MRPPRWAEWLLGVCLPSGLIRDSALGDLEEEFAVRAAAESARAARRWYMGQAVGIAFRYLPLRLGAAASGARRARPLTSAVSEAAAHATRSLRRSPGFVALTVLTLGIGVGATTAIFSVVDAVLLRPLAYPDPDQLVVSRYVNGDREIDNHSEPELWDLTREAASFSAVAGYRRDRPILGAGGDPERIEVIRGTGSLLPLLGVGPALGRVFSDEEDAPGAGPVAVLSHGLWVRAFGADPDIVGRTIQLEERTTTVVGVMPEGFAFPTPEVEAWLPLGLNRDEPWGRNNHYLRVIARLSDGIDLGAAAAELDALGARNTEAYPDFYANPMSFRAYPMRESAVGAARTALLLLFGAVVGVLLIASVNTAGLFLARGAGRADELAVRAALGAGRRRIAMQLLFESVVVSLLAALAGVGLARVAVTGLLRLAPPTLPRLGEVTVDGRILAFGLAAGVLSGILCGLVPALHASRSDVRGLVSGGGRGGLGRRAEARLRRSLVVVQISLATTLAFGTGLFLRSFAELRRIDLGFVPEGTLIVPLSPANTSVAPDRDAIEFYARLETRLRALPGVSAVGSALRIPLRDGHDNYSVVLEGSEGISVGDAPAPAMQWATPGYFAALGIPLMRGRLFAAGDAGDSPPVAVVSESLAQELWPGDEAVGRRLRMFVEGMPWMEIVGVVGDAKHVGVQEAPARMLYIPHAQGYRSAYYSPNAMAVFVRGTGDVASLAAPTRAVIREMSPAIPVGRVETMADVAGAALARERFTLLLMATFAVLALALAAIGVYGVIAQGVSARTREIGLRMAIGAQRGPVAAAVLREGLVLAAWGVGTGLVGGLALTWSIRAALYAVSPADPVALALTAPLLFVVVATACLVPALRAAGLDPVEALRDG